MNNNQKILIAIGAIAVLGVADNAEGLGRARRLAERHAARPVAARVEPAPVRSASEEEANEARKAKVEEDEVSDSMKRAQSEGSDDEELFGSDLDKELLPGSGQDEEEEKN